GDDLPSGVDYAVFDFSVNSGVSRAAKYLQALVGVAQDGVIGPKTLAAVAAYDPTKLVDRLCDRRMTFLRNLKTWNTFGRGWTSRVEGVRELAKRMAAQPGHPPVTDTPRPPQSAKVNWPAIIFLAAAALAAFLFLPIFPK